MPWASGESRTVRRCWCSGQSWTCFLQGTTHQGGPGITHWFYTLLLCETLLLFHAIPLTALSSETLREGRKRPEGNFLLLNLIFAQLES